MQKLELTINQTMGVITGNFDDIKKSLETEMAVYETKQFAEEDKQKAKGDLADLRKLRKAVNDRKVEVKKEYMKPYEVFEGKVKELIGVIDKPIALIDGQVKEFEAKRVEEKKTEIQKLYGELVEEELHDYIPLEKIYGEKWTNASTTMKSIREEIDVWCKENLDMDGMCLDCADITDHHTGDEQATVSGREWCEQWTGYCEDDYHGHYYWETEYPGKYLHMDF